MTIKQRRARASRAAKQRAIVKAVKGLLKKTNPSAKITGAKVVKLKGGVLKITPVKDNPSGLKKAWSRYMKEGLSPRVKWKMISSEARAGRRKRKGGKDYYREGR